MKAEEINTIFRESVTDYHNTNHVDADRPRKYEGFKELLYQKNWIDTVQWHLEDLIRDPAINPAELVALKRRIDASNQHRTDTVEQIDEWIYSSLNGIKPAENARLNSETPAWLLDRMSILQLKIYHFKEQLERKEAGESHLASVRQKLYVLEVQEEDLALAYNELMEDLRSGQKYMKLYKQMKMYNDPSLNPVLYEKK